MFDSAPFEQPETRITAADSIRIASLKGRFLFWGTYRIIRFLRVSAPYEEQTLSGQARLPLTQTGENHLATEATSSTWNAKR